MISVIVVLWAPIPGTDASVTAKDLLDYRQSILVAIITVFSAWVGAGAAYFFGRENFRDATEKMLQMRETPRERLRKTTVKEIPPRAIDWQEGIGKDVKSVYDRLKKDTERWFIPIINEDKTLNTVLLEEAVYRYIVDKKYDVTKEDKSQTIGCILKYLDETEELKERTKDIHVVLNLNNNLGYANDLMSDKGVKLGIVTDEKGKPTHYITTDDLRRALMREST